MKNPGRILLIILICKAALFALNAKISPQVVYEGDSVSLIISAEGNDIKFPKLQNIAGYKVQSQSISRNITNINEKVTKTLSKEFTFVAQKEFTIPPVKVEIDGKTQETKPIVVKVKKENQGKEPSFSLTLESDKKDVYIGEPINAVYVFKVHVDTNLAEASFAAPSFHNFWAKPTEKKPAVIEGDYQVHRIRYLLFAQKSGNLEIGPGRMDIGIMQKRTRKTLSFEQVKWKSIYSKGHPVKVRALPKGIDIYGDFKFEAKVDKLKTKANEPINLTVTVKGIGNVDDIGEFKLDIKDAIIYADKPEKKIYTNDKEELGEFTQKFAIVSDRNFTIQPLKFKFFHSKYKRIMERKSSPFKIEVEQSLIKTQTAKLEKLDEQTSQTTKTEIIYEKASKTMLTLFALGGFFVGLLTYFLLTKVKGNNKDISKKSEQPFAKRIKKSKSDKELLSLLLPYGDRSLRMKNVIKDLEENVYGGKNNKINKVDLVKNIEVFLKKEKNLEDILK